MTAGDSHWQHVWRMVGMPMPCSTEVPTVVPKVRQGRDRGVAMALAAPLGLPIRDDHLHSFCTSNIVTA